MGSTREINGVGVGVVALGVIVSWAGIRNVSLIAAFKDLAMGKQPTPNPKPAFSPFGYEPGTAAAVGASAWGVGETVAGMAAGGKIVQIAASMRGQCYGFGAGHGPNPCASKCTDCSSYVSCVYNKAGLMKGSMATGGLSKFGVGVPFEQRQPGDILVWNGGAGGGHCGIVEDGDTMWHNPCTGCGGVARGKYGRTRTGRPTIVRRAKASAGGSRG